MLTFRFDELYNIIVLYIYKFIYIFYTDYLICVWNNDCTPMCLKAYVAEYALQCTGKWKAEHVTCGDVARMLYGGKNLGCKNVRKTRGFARAVTKCVERIGRM